MKLPQSHSEEAKKIYLLWCFVIVDPLAIEQKPERCHRYTL